MFKANLISVMAKALLGAAIVSMAFGTQALAHGGGGHGGGGGAHFGGAHFSAPAAHVGGANFAARGISHSANFAPRANNFDRGNAIRQDNFARANDLAFRNNVARNVSNAARTNVARSNATAWNRATWNRNWLEGERYRGNFDRYANNYRPYNRYYNGRYYGGPYWRSAWWWPWWNYGYNNYYAYGWPNYYDYPVYGYEYPAYTSATVAVQQPTYSETAESGTAQTGAEYFSQAVDAFQAGDYSNALRQASHAAIESPQNPKAAELMTLASFAMGNYDAAAGPAHAALALGPTDTWANVFAYYGDAGTYTTQLRNLEKYCKDNPSAADAHFVLAYQYLLTGHPNSAAKQFNEVVKLAPQDKLAANLAKQYSEEGSPSPPAPPPATSTSITPGV